MKDVKNEEVKIRLNQLDFKALNALASVVAEGNKSQAIRMAIRFYYAEFIKSKRRRK